MLTSHCSINKMSNLNRAAFGKCMRGITRAYANETDNRAVAGAINPSAQFGYHHGNNTHIIRHMLYSS